MHTESIVTPPVYTPGVRRRWWSRETAASVLYALRIILEGSRPSSVHVYTFFLGCERKTRRQWWRRRWVFTAAAGNWCQFDGRPSFTPPPPSHRYTYPLRPPSYTVKPTRVYTTTIIVIITTSTRGNRFYYYYYSAYTRGTLLCFLFADVFTFSGSQSLN